MKKKRHKFFLDVKILQQWHFVLCGDGDMSWGYPQIIHEIKKIFIDFPMVSGWFTMDGTSKIGTRFSPGLFGCRGAMELWIW